MLPVVILNLIWEKRTQLHYQDVIDEFIHNRKLCSYCDYMIITKCKICNGKYCKACSWYYPYCSICSYNKINAT